MGVDRLCMSDHIRKELSKRIYDGTLKAGQRLVELEIAREFDTSQTPVREALRELESQRLVESIPYRGTRVRALSNQEMAEAYAVRGVLEEMAAKLAARLLGGNAQHLRRILKELHAAARADDLDAYAKSNYEFHRAVVLASRNSVLLQTWDSLSFETRIRLHIAQSRPNLLERVLEHDPVVAALEAGQGSKAGKLLRMHAESFMKYWEGCLPEDNQAESEQPVLATAN
jgi:DNA-binding GntR family transcriptional regulator